MLNPNLAHMLKPGSVYALKLETAYSLKTCEGTGVAILFVPSPHALCCGGMKQREIQEGQACNNEGKIKLPSV